MTTLLEFNTEGEAVTMDDRSNLRHNAAVICMYLHTIVECEDYMPPETQEQFANILYEIGKHTRRTEVAANKWRKYGRPDTGNTD